MSYKFIGTEQDLIDNGYIDDALGEVKPIELNELDEFFACKTINKNNTTYYIQIYRFWENGETLVSQIKVYMCDLRLDDYAMLKNCVLVKNIKPYIQDLIDKGLVVKV